MPKALQKISVGPLTKNVLKQVAVGKGTIHKPPRAPPVEKKYRSPHPQLVKVKTVRSPWTPRPPVMKTLGSSHIPVNNAGHSLLQRVIHSPDTLVGYRDTKLKVRVCLELREETIKKKVYLILEATIIGVRNMPMTFGKTFNLFAKLALIPEQEICTTDLTINWLNNSCENVEIFRFPIRSDYNSLERHELHVDLCEGRLTRNSKTFGRAVVSIKDLKRGEPLIGWHDLHSSE